jgi:hypothetical protein
VTAVSVPGLHDRRWPWCPYGSAPHTHTETLGQVDRVNGYAAGPMLTLRARAAARNGGQA